MRKNWTLSEQIVEIESYQEYKLRTPYALNIKLSLVLKLWEQIATTHRKYYHPDTTIPENTKPKPTDEYYDIGLVDEH